MFPSAFDRFFIMKKVVFLVFLASVFSISGAAQKSNAPVKSVKPTATTKPVVAKPIAAKPVVAKQVAAKPIAAEISETEWKVLADALQAEDWTKSASTAALYLGKLKADNDKKQIAQLRYLRLYALAGKILAVAGANVPADTDALWKDLDDAASEFNGKEFILPPHSYLNECEKRVNYICRVADNDRALRVTATNKDGTAIHSFDYVVFDDKNLLNNLPESELFLGGTLKRIEYNQDASKPWVMRLTYEKGFVSSVNK